MAIAHDPDQPGTAHAHPAEAASSRLSEPTDEQTFLAENDAAMGRMMSDMAIKPTGDIDKDFVAMMAPHHQGAIDLALAVLRYGRNEQIRRLAQEIIITQQQEIVAMRLAIGDLPAAPSALSSRTNLSGRIDATADAPAKHDAIPVR
jgi:uncharacterized protein (DUF305 family)